MIDFSARLENTQSVARDHLANERTFLAWLRTSLTFASVGVALAQLFRLNTADGGRDQFSHRASSILGAVFVGSGILVLFLGTMRYFHVQRVLQSGQFPATRLSVLVGSFISLSLVVVALAIIVKSAA